MTWMCTTFYSYFWVPDRELPTKGLVSIPSHMPETVNETEVSPFYPSCPAPTPTSDHLYPAPLCLRVYCCLVWFVQLFVSPVSEVVWYLSSSFSFFPSLLVLSAWESLGRAMSPPLGLSFLISEDKGQREMQLQCVRSRPLGPCTALGCVFTYF